MIDEKKLEELQNREVVHPHWIDYDGKCLYDDLMQSLSAALKVVRAAQKVSYWRGVLRRPHYERVGRFRRSPRPLPDGAARAPKPNGGKMSGYQYQHNFEGCECIDFRTCRCDCHSGAHSEKGGL